MKNSREKKKAKFIHVCRFELITIIRYLEIDSETSLLTNPCLLPTRYRYATSNIRFCLKNRGPIPIQQHFNFILNSTTVVLTTIYCAVPKFAFVSIWSLSSGYSSNNERNLYGNKLFIVHKPTCSTDTTLWLPYN